jgi:hypothetical protein
MRLVRCCLPLLVAFPALLPAQDAVVVPAAPLYMPAPVDSNSPALWIDGQFTIFNSAQWPLVSRGANQFLDFDDVSAVNLENMHQIPIWLEAAWLDEDGLVWAWYHHEPVGLCPGSSLTAPWIGAMVSLDKGQSFIDLGPILTSPDPPNCAAANGYFASGHGDFSVIIDRNSEYFYFIFGNYGGDGSQQGIAIARMAVADRFAPAGTVWKYFNGEWSEPGLGGQVTPIFPARQPWQFANTDSFWGPSVHWNTYLQRYVMLMSHSCCGPGWPQAGIYVSYADDLANPQSWSTPKLLLDEVGFGPGWYPQVLGTAFGETDTVAGQAPRLYIHGVSHWEIRFFNPPASPSRAARRPR